MKNIALTCILACLGLVSCGGTTTPRPAESAPPSPAVVAMAPAPMTPAPLPAPMASAPVNLTVSGDNWSFTLPDETWVRLPFHSGPLAVVVNPDMHVKILLMGEEYTGPVDLFPGKVLAGAKKDGGKVVTSEKVTINGNNFTHVMVAAAQENLTVWIWLTVKSQVGYAFMCGGIDVDKSVSTVCSGIASTLQLN